jgi:P27 family predicted phage terminase small subunit
MPAGLSLVAQAEWKRLVPKLGRRKTLTKADASGFEIYVRMYSRYVKVADLAEANPLETVYWTGPDGVVRSKTVESPASKMAARLEGQLARYLKEFSATPASRDKTKAAPPPPPPADPNAHVLDRNAEQPVVDDTPEIDIWSIES